MDPYILDRFLLAQANTFNQAFQELQASEKKSHRMWYIFPQLQGLGYSYNATFYGISGREEADAYINHPILGPRLIEISRALLSHTDKSIEHILGQTDALKLKSCMELFGSLPGCNPVFDEVLHRFYKV